MPFVSDIDGTLLDSERRLSRRTINAIGAVLTAEHHFVLCSSRSPQSIRQLQMADTDKPQWIAAYNGALVIGPDNETLVDRPIAAVDAQHIFDLCAPIDLHASFYSDDEWFSWGNDQWHRREIANTAVRHASITAHEYIRGAVHEQRAPHKVMLMGDSTMIDAVDRGLADRTTVTTYRAKDTYLEVAHAQTSKAHATIAVADRLGVPASEVVYFGNGLNDVSALRAVGTGVAVANAEPEAAEPPTSRQMPVSTTASPSCSNACSRTDQHVERRIAAQMSRPFAQTIVGQR